MNSDYLKQKLVYEDGLLLDEDVLSPHLQYDFVDL